jgi:hypothetical protein
MHRFAMAASHRTHLSVAKHNAECEVRDCEEQLRVRRRNLRNVIADLRDADRGLDDLWESVLRPVDDAPDSGARRLHPASYEFEDTDSTSSDDSASGHEKSERSKLH